MEILPPFICSVLLVGLVIYVGYPLVSERTGNLHRPSERPAIQLQERKEQVYASIKELELDHSIGKLSNADYRSSREQLETEAVEILRVLDQMNGHPDPLAIREQIEQDVLALRSSQTCASCGSPRRSGDRFCPQCGSDYSAAGARTPPGQ